MVVFAKFGSIVRPAELQGMLNRDLIVGNDRIVYLTVDFSKKYCAHFDGKKLHFFIFQTY